MVINTCICSFSRNGRRYGNFWTIEFNPITDSLINEEGVEVRLDPPVGLELPLKDLMLGTTAT